METNERRETQIQGKKRQKTQKRVGLVERETERSSRAGRGAQKKRGKGIRKHDIIQKMTKVHENTQTLLRTA